MFCDECGRDMSNPNGGCWACKPPAAFAGYRYREPTMIVGDSIDFRDNNGNLLHGTCTFIRTHYNSKYEAYHIYSMLVDGHKRQKHVGEENLVR